MTEPTLQDKIYSNDYFDVILPLSVLDQDFAQSYSFLDPQLLCAKFGMIHVPAQAGALPAGVGYSQVPKLYTTLDTTSLEASGILRVQTQPSLNYLGENILLGFIDTGIDYTLDAFRQANGATRILAIWDQTLPSARPPFDLEYGTQYTQEEINLALQSAAPYDLVPQRDTNGHGTFLAGVAAGSADPAQGFTGVAPAARIAVVKLKPAKQNLRDYFLIRDDAVAFQETDIMLGVRYLILLAQSYKLPLIICLGLGTNQGDHSGNSPLERDLAYALDYLGYYCAAAAGNETGAAHHYYQNPLESLDAPSAEILVDEADKGFFLEIWADSPDLYGVSVSSPLGETIPRIPPRLGTSSTYNFVAERTVLQVTYEIAEYTAGSQLILLRFQNPTPGIWRIRVSGSDTPLGSFHMWLPVSGFISPQTVFLNPSPYTTLTSPATAQAVISVANYNAYSGSLAIDSGRGYTRTGLIKPDLTAPGVEVYGPAIRSNSLLPPLNRYTRRSGTSVSAAITAGTMALLLNWNQDQPKPQLITNRAMKDYLTRGAIRQSDVRYPNQEWGYGTLNLYRVFETLM